MCHNSVKISKLPVWRTNVVTESKHTFMNANRRGGKVPHIVKTKYECGYYNPADFTSTETVSSYLIVRRWLDSTAF